MYIVCLKYIHILLRQVDAVGRQEVVSQYAKGVQELNGCLPVPVFEVF